MSGSLIRCPQCKGEGFVIGEYDREFNTDIYDCPTCVPEQETAQFGKIALPLAPWLVNNDWCCHLAAESEQA